MFAAPEYCGTCYPIALKQHVFSLPRSGIPRKVQPLTPGSAIAPETMRCRPLMLFCFTGLDCLAAAQPGTYSAAVFRGTAEGMSGTAAGPVKSTPPVRLNRGCALCFYDLGNPISFNL